MSASCIPSPSRPRWVGLLVAVGCPVVAALVVSVFGRPTTTVAAMFFLLAVVVAAVLGGLAGGLGASFVSFLGMNVLFTPPVGTFRVQKAEDFVALLAFLGVSGLIATLLTQARNEKARAQRREQEAYRAQAEAETSKTRAALFSSVTHDLRTPLASIKASATSLIDEQVSFDPAQRTELLGTIVEETDRLNRLIGNLLDLSRLRAGALVPEKVPTPIEEVIEGVVSRLRGLLAGREVTVRVPESIPAVPMDVMQIDQVLTNLLENAVNYSPDNSAVEISAAMWQSSVEVHVTDAGTGIPEDERSKVFEEFYRRDVAGRKGGTGLGLAIARAMVIAHGGQMWIADTPGGGTTVGFRLPLGT